MTIRRALCSALVLAFATCAWSAENKPSAKPVKAPPKSVAKKPAKVPAKTAAKTPAKGAAKAPVKVALKSHAKTAPRKFARGVMKTSFTPRPAPAFAPALPLVLKGPKEVLTCRDGTEDRHARIAVVLVGGRADSFAYYSKWKPRTCSIYLQRNRDSSRWVEKGSVTNVSTDRGVFLIEHSHGEYRFVFRDVDRERFCGMDGTMNGTLTLRKGSEHCEIAGIMEEGVPLGQAVAYMEQNAAAAAVAVAPAAPAAPAQPAAKQAAQRKWWQGTTSAFPAPTVGLSD
jgi:hypothetical protein